MKSSGLTNGLLGAVGGYEIAALMAALVWHIWRRQNDCPHQLHYSLESLNVELFDG